MLRKPLIVALALAVALAAGVSQAKADSIVLFKAPPDLVVSSVSHTSVTVTNTQYLYHPTATAGPFWVIVDARKCTSWARFSYNYAWCWSSEALPREAFYVGSLAAGSSATLQLPYWADLLTVTVDAFQQVAERDETNNTYDTGGYSF